MRRMAPRFLLPVLAILAGALVAAGLSPAAPEKPAQPRFASLAAAKTYLRQGPSYRNRILWVYRRRGLPVEVLAEYDVWRRVRMPDGTVGWVHTAMLSARRTVVVTAKADAPLRADADPGSKTLALAQPGVIAKLETCAAAACQVRVGGVDGWIDKNDIWGVGRGERKR
jgi:SH3-like domain-containing protein